MSKALKGKCLCGSVELSVKPQAEQMDVCHCESCRKWSAGPYFAINCGDDVSISGEENISAYKSSEWAERLFCKNCGTSLIWRLQTGGENHVSAQLFDEGDKFPLKLQVFVDQKPENYDFANQTHMMTGEELFAMFTPSDDEAIS